MRERLTIEVILRAAQPIAHMAGNEGNVGIINRRRIQRDDGTFAEVPYISGDSLRHALRECGSYALLESAGLIEDPQLTEAALRLLFNGGMVGGAASAVKLDEWRELCELLPHIGLLGGCVGNRIREGALACDSAILICEETAPHLPEWVGEWLDEHGRRLAPECEHVELVQRTRMDPTLRPSSMRLLASGAAADVEARLLASEAASAADDDRAKLATKSTMMPFEYQAVVVGSLWYWRVVATVHSVIERDAMDVMMSAFLARPYVGGKRNQGNGLMEVVEARGDIRGAKPTEADDVLAVAEIQSPSVARYRAHVAERRERIRDCLARVVA